MLFNSYGFIYLYLPVVFIGFFVLGRRNRTVAAGWLAAASLFFYGWWSSLYVPLLLGSVVFNFGIGYWLGHASLPDRRRAILIFGVAADLLLLAYFKYADFFIQSWNQVSGSSFPMLGVVLPLGISFFTFTQIAFLVDVYRGIAREYRFVHYLLFVTYFPHLIAGPVLHHKQMMPQFADASVYRPQVEKIAIGLALFIVGLSKKVLLGDNFATLADPVFAAAAHGGAVLPADAWMAALAYTFQLYFDFSGYSDMAIGLSLLFGIRLPINFDSPYKARSIADFWRRWHMTLSQFLRDYLYIPLGGNRYGTSRRYLNLLLTMLLGGLWHGANWTFVAWGALHGALLTLNHATRPLVQRLLPAWARDSRVFVITCIAATFVCVVCAWVLFRAETFSAAATMLAAMAGFSPARAHSLLAAKTALPWLALGSMVVWGLPGSQRFCGYLIDAAHSRFALPFNRRAAVLLGCVCCLVLMNLGKISPFLYYQF